MPSRSFAAGVRDFPPERRWNIPRKVALASVLKARTCVDNEWIAQLLETGHNSSVSRLIRHDHDHPEINRLRMKLPRILSCEDSPIHADGL